MKSKVPVVILVAIILMGVLLWTISALRTGGGVDPERAKLLAEEAEKECVLMGHPPEQCPKMVGRHHRDCLAEAEKKAGSSRVAEEDYLGCMKRAFGEPEGTGIGAPSDTPESDATSDEIDGEQTD